MSFSYVPSELADNNMYQVRFNTGQTEEYSSVVIADEEIQFLLSKNYSDVSATSVDVLNSLITKASYLVTSTTGEVSSEYSQLLDNLIKSRDDLVNSIERYDLDADALGFTGIFNDDRKQVITDDEVYKDGNVMPNKVPRYRTINSNSGTYYEFDE